MNDYFHDWTNRYTIQTLLESDNSFINILFPLGITFMEWNKMFKFTPESDKVSFVHFDLGEGK